MLAARALLSPESGKRLRVILAAALLVGAVTPLAEWSRHAAGSLRQRRIVFRPGWEHVPSLPALHDQMYAPANLPFLDQYVGAPQAPFFRYLAKTPAHGCAAQR